jgi:membrane associated rhomboid family serine protease
MVRLCPERSANLPRRIPLVNKLPAHLGDGVIGLGLSWIAVWLLGAVLIGGVGAEPVARLWYDGLALSLDALAGLRLWTLLSYGWLHDLSGPLHLLGNLIGLYFLAPPLEARWRARGLLRFFAICVVGGGVFAAGGAVLGGLFGTPSGVTVGASAGVIGVLTAWSMMYPRERLLLMFIVPIEGRWVLPLVLGVDALLALSGSDVSFAAHLGGAVAAWLQLGGGRRLRAAVDKRRAARERAAMRERLRVVKGGRDDEPMIH